MYFKSLFKISPTKLLYNYSGIISRLSSSRNEKSTDWLSAGLCIDNLSIQGYTPLTALTSSKPPIPMRICSPETAGPVNTGLAFFMQRMGARILNTS
jgi:hypothetical protein